MSFFPVKICFLITLLQLTTGQSANVRCPQPPVQENFDSTRFLGLWYELYTYKNGSTAPSGYKCYLLDYFVSNQTLWGNGTFQQRTTFDDSYVKIVNSIGTFNSSEPAKIITSRNTYYWILDTDYDNYLLLWSCYDQTTLNPPYTELAWIVGRRNTLSQEIFDSIVQKLPRYGIQKEYLVKSIHDDSCTYPACI